jgi:hypothetical protein
MNTAAQHNMRKQAKSLLPIVREIEINTAELWLSTGAIRITDLGEENTYYENEFGHLFFCKNYPTYEEQAATERPGDHAAALADEWDCSYSDALVYCNCD